jgi:hypothetical protein
MSVRYFPMYVMMLAIALSLVLWMQIARPRTPVFRWLGVLLVGALAVELSGHLIFISGRTNVLLYFVSTTVEFLLVLRILQAHRPAWRPWLLGAAVLGLVPVLWSILYEDPLSFLSQKAILTEALLLVIALLATLWDLARHSEEPLQRVPAFWFFLGMLIYFGGLVPVIAIIRVVYIDDPSLAAHFYNVIPVLATLRYLLTAMACRLEALRPRPVHG